MQDKAKHKNQATNEANQNFTPWSIIHLPWADHNFASKMFNR